MVSKDVWFFKDATLEVAGSVIATVSGSSSLESQMPAHSTLTSRAKDLTIDMGTRDIEPINVMGAQQLRQENRPEIVSASFNTVFYPQIGSSVVSMLEFLFGQGEAVGATGYNRLQGGEGAKTSGAADRVDCCVLFKGTRPGSAIGKTVTILMNNAVVVSGPVKGDAEGHLEQEWTVKCLQGDLYIDSGISADPGS